MSHPTGTGTRLSFGLKTTQWNVTYDDIVRTWKEADAVPEIEHAWLWDHMVPLRGDPASPVLEGWTLLAALAAQTSRLRLGLMVTSNRLRPPTVLAKIAATTDIVARGRLEFGIGVGGTAVAGENPAEREFAAYGLSLPSPAEGVARLAESCTIIKRMWTEKEPFDHEGRYYRLEGAVCEPKPVQRPHPPFLIAGMGEKLTLRVIAEHAGIWSMPGPPHCTVEEIRRKTAVFEEHCAAIGRDPREVTRSVQTGLVDFGDPAALRGRLMELIDAGVTHLVLAPYAPLPSVRWLADEVIAPVAAEMRAV